jgi:hypothetical protein
MRQLTFTRLVLLCALFVLAGCGSAVPTAVVPATPAASKTAGSPPAAAPTAVVPATPAASKTAGSPPAAAPTAGAVVPATPAASKTAGSPPAAAPTAGQVALQAPQAAQGSLKRRDAPPAGVKDQLQTFGAGAGSTLCPAPSDAEPAVFLCGSNRTEVGRFVVIRFTGFVPDQMIDIELQRPDGRRRTHRIVSRTPDVATEWMWRTRADDPPGQYAMTAVQGELRADTRFSLDLPARPTLWVLPGYSLASGSRFAVHVAGFPPGETLVLHVYGTDSSGCRGRNPCLHYRTTFPAVVIGADGRAVLEATTAPEDTPDLYFILTDAYVHKDDRQPPAFGAVQLVTPPPFPGVLWTGDSNLGVKTVQERLRLLSYNEVGVIDGVFGPNTEAAVRSFQQRNGLTGTGAVDAPTWERLFGPDGVANE